MAVLKTMTLDGFDIRSGEDTLVRTWALLFDNLAIRYDPIPLTDINEGEFRGLSAWTVFHVKSNRAIFWNRIESHEAILAATMAVDPLFSDMPDPDDPDYETWWKRNEEHILFWWNWLDEQDGL